MISMCSIKPCKETYQFINSDSISMNKTHVIIVCIRGIPLIVPPLVSKSPKTRGGTIIKNPIFKKIPPAAGFKNPIFERFRHCFCNSTTSKMFHCANKLSFFESKSVKDEYLRLITCQIILFTAFSAPQARNF